MMTKLLLLGIFSWNKIGRIFNTTQVKVKGVMLWQEEIVMVKWVSELLNQ
jgi:hypothetical protein